MSKKFGKDLVLVIGNWSAVNVKSHEPIRGKSWRDFLKRQGFKVYLIYEFRTSCICPVCDSRLENFLPSVEKYSGSDKRRLLNRNLAAVLNFRRIVESLRKTNKIPEVLK
ncbi:hypothetical protein H4S02_006438, partial [Coemansia sp. RSA 2611]